MGILTEEVLFDVLSRVKFWESKGYFSLFFLLF